MDLDRFAQWRRLLAGHGAGYRGSSFEPEDYGDQEAEYRALRDAAALVDRSGFETLLIEGEDAARFLHGLTTGEVASMSGGSTLYTLVTDDRGRVLSDGLLWRRGARSFCLLCERGFGGRVLEWFEAHLIADRVSVRRDEETSVHLELAGPGWREALTRAGGPGALAEGSAHAWGRAGDSVADVLWGPSRPALARVPLAVAPNIWKRLLNAGFRASGERAAERRRIEIGRPRAAREFDGDVLPMEIGLEGAVSFTKGCYAGQEIIARATHRGQVRRMLAGLRIPVGAAPARGAPVRAEGADAGWITSAVAWPALGVLALVCVRRERAVPGAVVTVLDGGQEREAIVAALPF